MPFHVSLEFSSIAFHIINELHRMDTKMWKCYALFIWMTARRKRVCGFEEFFQMTNLSVSVTWNDSLQDILCSNYGQKKKQQLKCMANNIWFAWVGFNCFTCSQFSLVLIKQYVVRNLLLLSQFHFKNSDVQFKIIYNCYFLVLVLFGAVLGEQKNDNFTQRTEWTKTCLVLHAEEGLFFG